MAALLLLVAAALLLLDGPPGQTWPLHGWVEPPPGSVLVETLLPRPLPDGRPMQWRSHLYALPATSPEGFTHFIELQRSDGAYITCTSAAEGIEFCRATFLDAPKYL